MFDDNDIDSPMRTRVVGTLRITGLLAGLALAISWFAAYAGTNFLVASDLMKPWSAEKDPRPLWMVEAFLTFLAGLILVGGALRVLSKRQLKQIDRMLDE